MGWQINQINGKHYYQCRELNGTGIFQAVTTKDYGNMALHTGDDPKMVLQRRNLFLDDCQLNIADLVAARQSHGTRIQVVEIKDRGRGSISPENLIPDTDGLVTRERGLVLSIFTADCLPIFIYDPMTPAVGIVHAGWRGTIAGIAGKAIETMVSVFQTNPVSCIAAIGPGICGKCFQVKPDLADNFNKVYPQSVMEVGMEYYIDLAEFNAYVLENCGVQRNSIIKSNLCTCCQPDQNQPEEWYSYRKTATTGRMMGIITLV